MAEENGAQQETLESLRQRAEQAEAQVEELTERFVTLKRMFYGRGVDLQERLVALVGATDSGLIQDDVGNWGCLYCGFTEPAESVGAFGHKSDCAIAQGREAVKFLGSWKIMLEELRSERTDQGISQ
jgi:hypothetical protein